jgi:pimeloyl-ACP methyl ester carboxylesterase
VPLDYADPAVPTIQIAMIKHPATDPAHRIGSLFFNPGGLGGSGVATLPLRTRSSRPRYAPTSIWSASIHAGSGRVPICGASPALPRSSSSWQGCPAPSRSPTAALGNRFAQSDQVCAANAGPLLAHDSTADVARDMDLLRQAVGDASMNYLSVSYGSYLGATYAQLFPGKVRAIALDGNVDPVQWATGSPGNAGRLSTFLRLGSDQGSASTLNALLTLYGRATVGSCAFPQGARPRPAPSSTPCWRTLRTIRSSSTANRSPWRSR